MWASPLVDLACGQPLSLTAWLRLTIRRVLTLLSRPSYIAIRSALC